MSVKPIILGRTVRAMGFLKHVARGLCLVVLVATNILAQDVRDAPIHVGPLYITPVLELSRLGVDTNVFNEGGQRQSDFTVTLGPKVDIEMPLRRLTLSLETATDYVHYQRFASQRGVNLDLHARVEARLRRVTVFMDNTFLNTKQRPNTEIDLRTRRVENVAGAGLTLKVSRKMELTLAANQHARRYDQGDPLSARLGRLLDRDAKAAQGSLRYAVTPVTAITVTAETRRDRFTDARVRDNDSWSVVPGVEFHPRAIIWGSAQVGYRRQRGLDDALPDFSGPVATMELSYRVLGSTTLAFTATRDVEFSFEELTPYFVSGRYGVSVRHQLNQRFGVSGQIERGNNGYRRFVKTSLGDASTRTDTTRTYSAIVHRSLTRGSELNWEVSYYQRRSPTGELQDYEGLVAGISVGYDF